VSWDLGDEGWDRHEIDRSVLIVDDDPSVRSLLGFVFEDDGFTVSEAPGGAEALEVLRPSRRRAWCSTS
jgi:CheY-like chemotaxis protein